MESVKNFFVNLYQKFVHLSWVEWTIHYCKDNPVMAGIIGGIVLLLIVTLCVMLGVRKHRKHKARFSKPFSIVKPAQTTGTQTTVEEEAAPAAAETVVAETPAAEEISVAEEAPVVEEEPAVEVAAKEVPVEEAAPAEEAVVAMETTERATVKSKKAQEVQDALDIGESLEENAVEGTLSEESDTERIARYKGKWVICRVLTDDEEHEEMFFFELRASNGEKLLSSEEYTSYQGALRGIQTHKTNILKGNLKIALSKKGDYIFKLLSGKNMLLCMGENYPTKARCESAMDSTIRFAATAIVDENVQDIVVKIPKEEDTPSAPLPENCNGKWIIGDGLNAEGGKIFYFELYANNGEKLLASEEYTTYIGAVNGIQTHKKNIEKDNFRISLTKRGDYIYKLLNGNGQLLCLGEHYKTKRLCQNAVDSVKRFAMNSPILTEATEK